MRGACAWWDPEEWQVCRALREAGESERQAGSWKAAAEPAGRPGCSLKGPPKEPGFLRALRRGATCLGSRLCLPVLWGLREGSRALSW